MLVHYHRMLFSLRCADYIIFCIHPKVVCKCLGYNLCRVGAGSTTVLHRDGEQYSSRRASRAGHPRQASAPRRDWLTPRDGAASTARTTWSPDTILPRFYHRGETADEGIVMRGPEDCRCIRRGDGGEDGVDT
jgi:hypothetical protein